MLSRLITRSNILRRLISTATPFRFRSLPRIVNPPKILFLTSYPFLKGSERDTFMENFDLKLKDACDRGEAAISEFMEYLKNNVTEISKAYKQSLQKQIEIIDEASKAGPTSPKWDELPEYRTTAKTLNEQFQTFVASINTLGAIAQNETLQYITQQKTNFELIGKKHKELDKEVKKQIGEIKKLEEKVLAKNRESIKNAK